MANSPPSPPSAARRSLGMLLKIGVTLAGLLYVVSQIDLAAMWAIMRNAQAGWLLLALLLMMLSLALRAWRWQLLLVGLGATLPLRRLITLYVVGNFFNAFLLSGFGGDVVRALEAGRDVAAEEAAATVIIDRLSGLLMLFVMALIALPLRPDNFPPAWLRVIALLAAGGLVGGGLLLQGGLLRRAQQRLATHAQHDSGRLRAAARRLGPFLSALHGCGRRAILGALGVSLLFNLMLVSWWYAAARALGQPVGFGYLLLIVPILSLALLVPSVSGLGVGESLAPLLFAAAGLSAEAATALSLTVFLLLRVTSLFGAPVYVVEVARRERESRRD